MVQVQVLFKAEKKYVAFPRFIPGLFQKNNASQFLAHFARINNGLYVTS